MATPSRDDQMQELWRLSGLGLEFAGVIGGMTALGWLIDWLFNTTPIFLVVGAMFGLIGGSIKFVREAMAASRRSSQQAKARSDRREQNN